MSSTQAQMQTPLRILEHIYSLCSAQMVGLGVGKNAVYYLLKS